MAEIDTTGVDNISENERKTVRLTLISRHILPDMNRSVGSMSLFNSIPGAKRKEVNPKASIDPEDYPDEMNEALRVIMDNNAGADSRFGFDDDYIDDEPGDSDDNEENDEISSLFRSLFRQVAEEDDEKDLADRSDAFVFKTLGTMSHRILADGSEEIEITYDEGDSMDNTRTTILFNKSHPETVSILHEGGVASSIVCEKGVRHFSAYVTPVMPFEIAVYARKCEGILTFENGGVLDVDYILEIRGADVQRTIMRIYADILEFSYENPDFG